MDRVKVMEEKAGQSQTSEDPEVEKLQTSDVYRVHQNLPARFNNPDDFHGYSHKKIHPLYQTSNQLYGSKRPTVHHMPTRFFGTSRRFSEDLLRGGMFEDSSLNTSLQNAPISFNHRHHHDN